MFRSTQSLDAQSVEKVLSGEREAFEHLVRRYERVVWGIALASLRDFHAAEDLVQEAMLKAFKELGSLKQPSRFGPWLVQITRNLLVDHSRRAALRVTAPLEEQEATDTESIEQRELHRLLRGEVLSLPPAFREAILLHYFGGKSAAELAPLLGISRAAAHKRIERARQLLGRKLEEHLEEAFAPRAERTATRRVLMAAIATTPLPARAGGTGAAAVPAIGFGVWKFAAVEVAAVVISLGWWQWKSPAVASVEKPRQVQLKHSPERKATEPIVPAAAEVASTAAATAEVSVPDADAEDRGIEITGRIRNAQGGSIARADVIGYSIDGFHAETKSDEEGNYSLSWLGAREYRIRVRAEGHLPVTKIATAPARADFVLEQGGDLHCRVLDKDTQAPIGGVTIRLRGTKATSDNNGFVSLVPEAAVYLNPSETVAFETRGYLREHIPYHELIADRGQPVPVFLEAMAALSGEVVNQQGYPLPGVKVVVLEPELGTVGSTDESGRFLIEHLEEWPDTLYFACFGLPGSNFEALGSALRESNALGVARLRIEAEEQRSSVRHRVVMEGGGALRVRVPKGEQRWWDTSSGMTTTVSARVRDDLLQSDDEGFPKGRASAVPEASGDFYFPLLPPGEAQIELSSHHYRDSDKTCPDGSFCHVTTEKSVLIKSNEEHLLNFDDTRVAVKGKICDEPGSSLLTFTYDTHLGNSIVDWGSGSFSQSREFEIHVLAGSRLRIWLSRYHPAPFEIRRQIEVPSEGTLTVDLESCEGEE